MTRDYNRGGDKPETSNTTLPVPPPTQQIPHTISSIKLPILKKGEYDIWAIKMEHYLSHTDYPIWQVIQNGNGLVSVTSDTNGMIKVLPPVTGEEVVARERERKARTTFLMALLEDHLAKNSIRWLMQKRWSTKGYDRFQTLLSQLKIHGASVSHKDANQKFLRSLPSSWSQVALIMRTKPGLDTLSFDDLYNNLRFFEHDVKGTTASSSNTQNVAFVYADNTSSTNDVSIAYSVSSPSVSKSQKEGSSSYNDEVAMISMRIKKFHKRTSKKLQFDTKDLVGFDKTKVKCFNFHKIGHFARDYRAKGNQDIKRRDVGYNGNKARDNGRRPAYQDDLKALVTINGEDIDWSRHVEQDVQNFATMAYSSINSGSDNEESDIEDTPVNDIYAEGMHVVPPPMTRNYMPSGPDVEIDYSKFTYGPKQNSVDELDSKPSEYTSCESDSSVEITTSMPAPVENAPAVVCEPKVWTDAPIIEEYESDNDNDSVFNVHENKEKPSFAFTDSVKHVKPSRENVKETSTSNHCPKVKKQDINGPTRKGLGYAFNTKACFVCGSFSHLIRDCDFHEKRMAKQAALTKSKNKVSGKKENRPVWNNVQRINHQNKFVPTVLLTKTGKVPVSAARQNYSRKASSTSTASKVNTARPFVNETRPKRCFCKTYSLNKRPFHNKTIQRTTFSSHKVNTINTSLSTVKGNWDTIVKASASYLPFRKKAIWTKWVYRNKKDERGVVVRNKARLVTQGHRQEEGIDYDEVFAPVDKIEAIRIFLAFASYMGFIVYQMDVKSALLYGTIDEEKSRYRRGAIDKTLFIKQDKKDIMLVQVYVDDIIFGSTKKSWCDEFEELMKNSVKTTSTPIKTQKPLVKDEEAANVDVHLYRSMIGSLMHLTASRPDILFVVCACLRFQVTSKTSRLQAVKRIFRDAYEKKLIQVPKIHTEDNVAGLLTNAFNVSRFNFLVVNIGLLNL
nr:hypothetical protein [Tanacetum cinerariifolium]